jgi:glyoxylate reductase
MSKQRVFITRPIFQEAIDRIGPDADIEIWPEEMPPPYEVLKEKVRHADGLFCLLTDRIDATLMDSTTRLKVVSNMAVGYDNIDVPAATKRHIVVGYTPGVLTETTADLAFTLMMAAARRVVEGHDYTKQGLWKTWGPMTLLGHDIHHATLGIIGLGRIGTEVARRAMGFSMNVIYTDAHRCSEEQEKELGVKYAGSLKDLLSASDFVTVHVPLSPQTYHLISAAELALMKPAAVFINTSRGGIVDQKALYEALKSRRIFAAGLDVAEVEPIPLDDPLLTLDNVIILPHIASASYSTRRKMASMAADNLVAGLCGTVPQNCVNPEALK